MFQPTEFVIGLFTLGGTVWLTAYGFARLYNRLVALVTE